MCTSLKLRLMVLSLTQAWALTGVSSACVETPTPVWSLTNESFHHVQIEGDMEFDGETLHLNGENRLTLPPGVLGGQKDYTIEFEVKCPSGTVRGRHITLVSNMNKADGTGFELVYCPPDYNAGWLFVNGHQTIEQRNFLKEEQFQKITLVVKDGSMMMFRDGMLLGVTQPIMPSDQPLCVGGIERERTQLYAVQNLIVYDQASLPEGFDASAEHMKNFGGDGYIVQRVNIRDKALPRVLIIGDSISMGYRGKVSKLLKGRANVDYWTQGYWHNLIDQPNSIVFRAISGAVSQGPYAVITFNFGLHSWTHPERSPEDKYLAQASKLVEFIQDISPESAWIWVRTTPLTSKLDDGTTVLDAKGNDRIVRFNQMTDLVMATHGIPEVDLYTLCLNNLNMADYDGVHWSHQAYNLMGERVAAVIEIELEKRAAMSTNSRSYQTRQ